MPIRISIYNVKYNINNPNISTLDIYLYLEIKIIQPSFSVVIFGIIFPFLYKKKKKRIFQIKYNSQISCLLNKLSLIHIKPTDGQKSKIIKTIK